MSNRWFAPKNWSAQHAHLQSLGRDGRRAVWIARPSLDWPMPGTLAQIRWTLIAAMLLISLSWPAHGRFNWPDWLYVGLFAGYNLVIVRISTSRIQSFVWVPFLDLPLAGVLYFLAADSSGPMFIGLCIALLTAALCWPLGGTVLYVATTVTMVVFIAPTFPSWSATAEPLRSLVARLVALLIIGIGLAILSRRLAREQVLVDSLRKQTLQQETADQTRFEFLSTISHDLRTPLTAIQSAVRLLQTQEQDRLSEDGQYLLANARRNTERLGLLIDDLLALNQLEYGSIILSSEPLDLRDVFVSAVESIRPLLDSKNQTVNCQLTGPLPVDGEMRQLERAFMNILFNAHAHTPPGTYIEIRAHAQPEHIEIGIVDDGPGIAAEHLEEIFERFHRLGDAASGSGLGLTVARGLIELHGGRIWAASTDGHGTSFNVRIPRLGGPESLWS